MLIIIIFFFFFFGIKALSNIKPLLNASCSQSLSVFIILLNINVQVITV